MKSGIALLIFVVALTVASHAIAAAACGGGVADHNPADARRHAPAAAMAMMGLVLFATGAVTRRSTIECA